MFPATSDSSSKPPRNGSGENLTAIYPFYLALRPLLAWAWNTTIGRFQTPVLPASTIVEQLNCTPRSYSREMEEISYAYTDRRVFEAYLRKALDQIPLNILQNSIYFWGNDNLSFICKLLADRPEQFRELVELTPMDRFNYLPAQCITVIQIEILFEKACQNKAMMQEFVDVILVMIGEPRNGAELDNLYYFFLKKLIERQETDTYIAQRLRQRQSELSIVQIRALQQIENAPLIAAVLQELNATMD